MSNTLQQGLNEPSQIETSDSSPGTQLSRATIIGYGTGSLGTGIFTSAPGILLLFYMTDILAIPAGLAAMAIFLPKMWDVITDPFMGYISDNTHSRWGRRRPYLLVGSILVAVTFVFLFNVPAFEDSFHCFLYVLIIFTLSATAYTIFVVPYLAMPAEMSSSHRQRTTIMSYRMGFLMAGLLVGGSAAPYLVAHFGGGRDAYGWMSVVLGLCCAGSMLVTFLATKNAPQTPYQKPEKTNLWRHFSGVIHFPAFSVLLGIYILQLVAMGVFVAAVPYFATYILGGNESQVGIFFLIMLGTSILSMAGWAALVRKTGKRAAFAAAAVIFGAGAASLTLTTQTTAETLLFLQLVIIGIGLAGVQMVPFAMLTDVIRLDAFQAGKAREGAFTGIWMASDKIGWALGPLIIGWILSYSGFLESAAGELVSQPESALFAIRLCAGALPGVAIICSALFVIFYPITEKQLDVLESE